MEREQLVLLLRDVAERFGREKGRRMYIRTGESRVEFRKLRNGHWVSGLAETPSVEADDYDDPESSIVWKELCLAVDPLLAEAAPDYPQHDVQLAGRFSLWLLRRQTRDVDPNGHHPKGTREANSDRMNAFLRAETAIKQVWAELPAGDDDGSKLTRGHKKARTTRGDVKTKIVAALLKHPGYDSKNEWKASPATIRELHELSKVSTGAISK